MKIIFFLCFLVSTCFSSFQGQLKIILKLDDLASLNGSNSFKLVTDYLAENKIKAGLGIIGNRVDNKSKQALQSLIDLKDENANDIFEFWHHGYDHIIPEFKGRDYAYQKDHFERGNQSVLNVLGIQMNTFGAPENAIDDTTFQVVNENPDYHVFFFNWLPNCTSTEHLVIVNQRADMENGPGNVNYEYFVQRYNYTTQFWHDYLVLQGHPNVWQAEQLEEFKKIINFLKDKGVEFVLPNDYYLSTRVLKAPVITCGKQTEKDNVLIEWQNNDDISNAYRIERSKDGMNWDRLNTQYSAAFAENQYNDNISYYDDSKEVYYRIRINGDVDNALYSNVVKVELKPDFLAVKQVKGSFFKILNNPFKDSVDIRYKFSKPGTVNLMIYNSEGKLVEEFKDHYLQENTIINNRINTQKLPAGIYVYIFSMNNGVISKNKIIKK